MVRRPPAVSTCSGLMRSMRRTAPSGMAQCSSGALRNSSSEWLFCSASTFLLLRLFLFLRALEWPTAEVSSAFACHSSGIDNQRHRAIAQDGCSGIFPRLFQVMPQRLHHDLLGVVKGLHDERVLEHAGGDDGDFQRSAQTAAPAIASVRGIAGPGRGASTLITGSPSSV